MRARENGARHTTAWARLAKDRRCVTAVETAMAIPIFLLLVIGSIGGFGILLAYRAIDYGMERGLRYAAVHGGSGITGVKAVFASAAGTILADVGANATVTVTSNDPTTSSNFVSGDTVTMTVSYVWNSPVGTSSPLGGTFFPQRTMTMTSSMLCVAP
jgi:Flp pilus assembly protein TadG